jgi:hypothetical protein
VSAPTIRTARKEHRCTEQSYHAIRPGDRYLYAACPPWHDVNRSGMWWVVKACLRCANEYGLHTADTRKRLEARP